MWYAVRQDLAYPGQMEVQQEYTAVNALTAYKKVPKACIFKYLWYQLVSTLADLMGEAFQVGEKSMALRHPIPKLSGDRHTNNKER